MLRSVYIFLAVVGPVLLLWLAFGPKRLLVKGVWVAVGVLLVISGLMMVGEGWVSGIGGIFFMVLGVVISVTAVHTYFNNSTGSKPSTEPPQHLRDSE